MLDEKDYFCDCIRKCESGMYTLALGILKNESNASDVMQDAILKAYCNLEALKDKRKFRPWIMSIVHNTAIEYLRKHRDIVDIEMQEIIAPSPVVDAETKLTVWEAIQQLKLPYRSVIILFYYEDYSIRQISAITSTSAPTVRQQLSRGRKMLAELLKKEDFV